PPLLIVTVGRTEAFRRAKNPSCTVFTVYDLQPEEHSPAAVKLVKLKNRRHVDPADCSAIETRAGRTLVRFKDHQALRWKSQVFERHGGGSNERFVFLWRTKPDLHSFAADPLAICRINAPFDRAHDTVLASTTRSRFGSKPDACIRKSADVTESRTLF